jgi:hypothetical protein
MSGSRRGRWQLDMEGQIRAEESQVASSRPTYVPGPVVGRRLCRELALQQVLRKAQVLELLRAGWIGTARTT